MVSKTHQNFNDMTNFSRKLFLIIAIITISIPASYAQFSFGLKLGGASTSLTGIGENVENFIPTPKMHFVGGGVITYSLGRRIGLQTEIMYSGKGSAIQYYEENSVGRGFIELDMRLGYLSVPFIFQFKMGDRTSYFHLDAGIVFNQLVHNKFTGTIQYEDDKGNKLDKTDYEIDNNPNQQDLGYTFGIGLVANGLMFDFAYEIGIRDVFPPSDGGLKIRNRSLKFTVGYSIRY